MRSPWRSSRAVEHRLFRTSPAMNLMLRRLVNTPAKLARRWTNSARLSLKQARMSRKRFLRTLLAASLLGIELPTISSSKKKVRSRRFVLRPSWHRQRRVEPRWFCEMGWPVTRRAAPRLGKLVDPLRLARSPSRFSTLLQVQLFTAVVTAVVEKRRPAIGQEVDELTPQVVTFASLERLLRNVFDPFDWLGREMPAFGRPFLIAPCKPAKARRRFLGPDCFLAGIGRGR